MAGNVSEWVRDAQFAGGEVVGEGFIGGSYAGEDLEVTILTPGGAVIATYNKLRDPAPSERVFRTGERTNKRFQKLYDKYHEEPDVTGPTIGFRCVIELKEE
jgi:formylglycine-generating enzyme required for sulfatase activity